MKKQPTLLFLHVPKTAGTTLRSILEQNYPRATIHYTDPGSPDPFGDFTALRPEKRAQFKVISGHYNFGFHTLLANDSVYITMLREPVERSLSEFYHITRNADHGLHEIVRSGQMDLEGYLNHLTSIYLDNRQMRLFAGEAEESDRGNPSSPEMLTTAKENLKNHFPVIGMTEHFDESLLLIKKLLGWQQTYYTRQNVGSNRPKQESIPTHERELLLAHNQYDLALYAYAQTLFEAQVQAAGDAFATELAAMREQNKKPPVPAGSVARRLRQIVGRALARLR